MKKLRFCNKKFVFTLIVVFKENAFCTESSCLRWIRSVHFLFNLGLSPAQLTPVQPTRQEQTAWSVPWRPAAGRTETSWSPRPRLQRGEERTRAWTSWRTRAPTLKRSRVPIRIKKAAPRRTAAARPTIPWPHLSRPPPPTQAQVNKSLKIYYIMIS